MCKWSIQGTLWRQDDGAATSLNGQEETRSILQPTCVCNGQQCFLKTGNLLRNLGNEYLLILMKSRGEEDSPAFWLSFHIWKQVALSSGEGGASPASMLFLDSVLQMLIKSNSMKGKGTSCRKGQWVKITFVIPYKSHSSTSRTET